MKFAGLINKHSQTYSLFVKDEGHWDGPTWVEGDEVEYEISAAIFPITAEEVERYEGLGYTTKDIKIFIPAPVTGYDTEEEETTEVDLAEDDELKYMGNRYVLDSLMDRTTHSDFVKWIAVRRQDSGEDGDNDD